MSEIRVVFACGHPAVSVSADAVIEDLRCACGDRRVQMVRAPAPRIVARDCDPALDMGPLVTYAE